MAESSVTADTEFDPSTAEDRDSQPWLNMLADAESKFRDWQDHADRIDRIYSELSTQASNTRDRQFAMFWANIQVLAPSIYARPPLPVVVPEFKDRDPVKRVTSEMLERALKKSFNLDDIDAKMRLVRDDMLICGRGVLWARYASKKDVDEYGDTQTGVERVCIDYIDRRDFLHEPARNWCDVGWVARRAWLTRKEVKERFDRDADVLGSIPYQVRHDGGRDGLPKEGSSPQEKAGIWEIWHKATNKVVWVVDGCPETLDEGEPHLELEGFFPCPRPAYTTVQRRTLIPVPDVMYYRDQLEEINKLTGRIHALSDAIQVKGFYPGGGEVGDAIEAALNMYDDRKIMIPVSGFAAFGGSNQAPIVWMPIDLVATTIAGLIEMRRQIIDDVYQIVGLSDIMRGTSESAETATAQQLKSQYGSIRIRDKQHELVRIAKDMTAILGEIIAENFSEETLTKLSQMALPKRSEIQKEINDTSKQLEEAARQVAQVLESPQAQQMAQENPEQAQEAMQQLQQQAQAMQEQAQARIAELQEEVTIDDVMELLRDQRIRPFALDIETDSTIQPDEDAEKQRRAEFLQVFGATMQQLAALVDARPESAEFAGEILKFALAPYRVGRELEGSIDKFVDQIAGSAGQDQQDPEAEAKQAEAQMKMQEMQAKAQIEQQKAEQQAQLEMVKMQVEQQAKAAELEMKREQQAMDAEIKGRELQARMAENAQKHQLEMEKGRRELEKMAMEMEALRESVAIKRQEAAIKGEQAVLNANLAERADERQAMAAERMAASRGAGNGNSRR